MKLGNGIGSNKTDTASRTNTQILDGFYVSRNWSDPIAQKANTTKHKSEHLTQHQEKLIKYSVHLI